MVARFMTRMEFVGSFTNPNHFSHILALGIGACAGWLLIRLKRPSADQSIFGHAKRRSVHEKWHTFAASVGVGIVVFTVLLAMSRGGILALAVAVIALACVCRKLLNRQLLLSGLGAVCVGFILLAINGIDDLAKEVDTVKNLSFSKADYKQMRTAIWGANIKAIQTRPWFGHGVGTHRDFYKTYLEKPIPSHFYPRRKWLYTSRQ